MLNNYDKLPSVEFGVDMKQLARVRAAAEAMARLGMPDAMEEYNRERARALAASKIFIRNAAADEVEMAGDIERQKVGHSKSGYKPTGTLQGSITPQFSDDGMKTTVLPLATSEEAEKARQQIKQGVKKIHKVNKPSKNKDAHYYGVDVEFGNVHMEAEPFMKPSGEKIAAQLDKKFEDIIREALE